MQSPLPTILAHHEIEWWKAHHRKQKDKLIVEMTKLFELQFNLGAEEGKKAVLFRVEAADWHDKAEAAEDAGQLAEANILWEKAENALISHFSLLQTFRKDN